MIKNLVNKDTQKNKGITLIALVITIIVLLILAGISISMLTGENGLLTKADDARINTAKANEEEQIKVQVMGSYNNEGKLDLDELEDNLGSIPGATVTKTNNEFTVTFTGGNSYKVDSNGNVTPISSPSGPTEVATVSDAKTAGTVFDGTEDPITDNFGNEVIVPEGFKIASDSADNVTGGVVIEDADSIKHPNTVGSQFVWIPVGKVYADTAKTEANAKIINLDRYDFADDGTPSAYSGSNTEDTASNHNPSHQNAIAKDIEEFITKANTKKGYYIGRYEARVENWTGNVITANSDLEINWTGYTNGNLVEKGNAQVFNYITQNKASELSESMYISTDFESDLINSYAWDTATLFLQEFDNRIYTSSDNSNYIARYSRQIRLSDGLKNTGTNNLEVSSNIDKICNVYDMADNCLEWSTETYSNTYSNCMRRGGFYNNNNGYTSLRYGSAVTNAYDNLSFRPILYIK